MQKISEGLEAIAKIVDRGSDSYKVEEAVEATRDLIKDFISKPVGAIHESPLLQELDKELSIWESKLAVILSEAAGRKGMAKHARFWAEKLRGIHV